MGLKERLIARKESSSREEPTDLGVTRHVSGVVPATREGRGRMDTKVKNIVLNETLSQHQR